MWAIVLLWTLLPRLIPAWLSLVAMLPVLDKIRVRNRVVASEESQITSR